MSLFLPESSPLWQFVSERNRGRQYDFLHTSVMIANANAGLEIDHGFVCALNLYATQYISPQPGRYRRQMLVEVGEHRPSDWPYVYDEMEAVLEILHQDWASLDEIQSAAYALWGVNHVHPFCDGNGRTSRALCYFVLCRKIGRWLPGENTIMEMIRTEERDEYCRILQRMHEAKTPDMRTDLSEMTDFLGRLVLAQFKSAKAK